MDSKIRNMCFSLIVVAAISTLIYRELNKEPPIDYDDYQKMPPLYLMDDYDDCLKETNTKYCVADIVIEKDEKSALWNYIEEFSSNNKHHYRHDILKYGFCLNKIRRQNLTKLNLEETSLESNIFVNSLRFRQLGKYFEEFSFDNEDQNDVQTFVSHKFKAEYGLKARSNVNFCLTEAAAKAKRESRFTGLNFVFICIVVTIFYATIIATIVDLCRSRTVSPVTNFCSAISLRTNLNYLFRTPATSNQLDMINGIKVLGEAAVLVIHTAFLLMSIPSEKPYYIESQTYEPIVPIFRSGIFLLQNFFAITAFLSFYPTLTQIMRGEKITGKDIGWMVVKRLVRLWPIMMFVILVFSSFLDQITPDGPVFVDLGGLEIMSCRKNWWTNLMFINNFYGADTNPCLQQSWHLGAEMQLFVVEIFIILLINRFPKKTGTILVSTLIVGNIVTTLTFYKESITGLVLAKVEDARTRYFNDAEFQRGHIPFYTNTPGYFIGLLAAYVHYQIKEKKIDFSNRIKLYRIWHAMYIFSSVIMLHHSIYSGIITPPSLLFSIYSTFCKNLGAIVFVTLLIFMGNSLSSSKNVSQSLPLIGFPIIDFLMAKSYSFLSLPLFKILVRLNLGVFLIHPFVGALIMMDGKHPIEYNSAFDVAWISALTLIASYLIAAVLFVMIEMPAINLFRVVMYKKSVGKDKNGNVMNGKGEKSN